MIFIEFCTFFVFYHMFRFLPLKLVYPFSRAVLRFAFYAGRRHRNRAISHLIHAGVARDRTEATQMAKLNYDHYGSVLTEMIKGDQILRKRKDCSETLHLTGSKKSKDMFFNGDKSQQCIIVTAHYGNWELAAYAYISLTNRMLTSVKRKMNNPLIGKYIFKQREADPRHDSVEKKGALRHLLRALHAGRTIALLVDQHASSAEGVETAFFNHPARTHFSPALLHLKTGIPIMVGVVRRIPGDNLKFEVKLADPIMYEPTDDKEKDVAAVAQLYTSQIEEFVREEPLQWMWVHRRWLNINRKSWNEHNTMTETTDECINISDLDSCSDQDCRNRYA